MADGSLRNTFCLWQAYHKANDERKQYVLEINAAKGSISEMKTRQRQALMAPGQPETGSSPRTYRDNAGFVMLWPYFRDGFSLFNNSIF